MEHVLTIARLRLPDYRIRAAKFHLLPNQFRTLQIFQYLFSTRHVALYRPGLLRIIAIYASYLFLSIIRTLRMWLRISPDNIYLTHTYTSLSLSVRIYALRVSTVI